jgi:alkylation response protein AidB-like acyl-CoA dehydrogenase
MTKPHEPLMRPDLHLDAIVGLMDSLTIRAVEAQSERESLHGDIEILKTHGWLGACAPMEAGGLGLSYQGASLNLALDFLFRLGGANLSLGRLFEGHANACKLVHMLATKDQADLVWEKVRAGGILGVWGADGQNPVAVNLNAPTPSLSGEKAFCSGLGIVTLAIVSAASAGGLQLLLIDVTETERGDPSHWQLSGMQATQSGTYNFDTMAPEKLILLGPPDAYYGEPHFFGGQWRYLALHAGCVAEMAQTINLHLNSLNRPATDSEAMRMARLVGLSQQSMMWATHVANQTEVLANPEAGLQAIIGREMVECSCVEAVTLAERIIGTQAFKYGHRLERLCRDLRTYLRQAALDQRLIHAGQSVLALSATGQSFLEQCGAMPLHERGHNSLRR